ncbi:hypothetical protein [Klebsiella pneumoniae]|nr:hypothetical protein [Klebsiella pneumoniae]
MTIMDATSSPVETSDVSIGTLSLALATIGETRRGSTSVVEGSNPNSKITEVIIYKNTSITDRENYYENK